METKEIYTEQTNFDIECIEKLINALEKFLPEIKKNIGKKLSKKVFAKVPEKIDGVVWNYDPSGHTLIINLEKTFIMVVKGHAVPYYTYWKTSKIHLGYAEGYVNYDGYLREEAEDLIKREIGQYRSIIKAYRNKIEKYDFYLAKNLEMEKILNEYRAVMPAEFAIV